MAQTHKPTIQQKAAENACPNCGKALPARPAGMRGRPGIFCPAAAGETKSACKLAHEKRRASEGAAAIAMLKAWRIDRGSGEIAQEAFRQLCTIIDTFNADDKAAGRPRADLFAAKLMADGRLYMDRKQAA